MNLTKLFYYVVSLSLMGSIITIGILIIKRLFRQKLGANFHYYIWFMLILRLIIPYTPLTAFSAFNFMPSYSHVIDFPQISNPSAIKEITSTEINTTDNNLNTPQEPLTVSKNNQTSQVLPSKPWFSWQTLSLAWIIGAIATFSYILLVNGLLVFRSKKLSVCDSHEILQILEECKAKLNVKSKVMLVYDETIKSPAIFGLYKPKISISSKLMSKLTPEELHYIFLHELSHLKRGDLFINGLLLSIQTIYWFNPIIWYALHLMKQDCEIACDANALSVINPKDHKKYGQTIINLLQLFSEPHWAPGTLGFISKFNARRIVMISTFKKTSFKWSAAALTLTLLVGCTSLNNPIKSITAEPNQNSTNPITEQNTGIINTTSNSTTPSSSSGANSAMYNDGIYGFSVSLPVSWRGFSVVNSMWQGLAIGDASGEKVVATGPKISIRHPKWTLKVPRQDIPIMVFTIEQWNSLQNGVFHIGAAPIGPSELGRNNIYVFALPARYNFAFLPGYEEVEKILDGKPLKTTNIDKGSSDSIAKILLNVIEFGKQGKVRDGSLSAISVKTNTIEDVEKSFGKADKIDWVAAAKGRYATYSKQNVVFGINKGEQIFEIRTSDIVIKSITLSKTKAVLGNPAYDAKSNGQEILGYVANSEFKVEFVFPEPNANNPDPVIDHYNVLYPAGTVNNMSGDAGRQW